MKMMNCSESNWTRCKKAFRMQKDANASPYDQEVKTFGTLRKNLKSNRLYRKHLEM